MIHLFRPSALTRFNLSNNKAHHRTRRRPAPAPWVGLEALESRVMLSTGSILHSFTEGPSSTAPIAGTVLVGSKLYGVSEYHGANNTGTLYSIKTDGSGYQIIHEFGGTLPGGATDGNTPMNDPIVVGSKLFGTTLFGGPGNFGGSGVIYSINLDGSGYTLVHTFTLDDLPDGANPWGGLVTDGTTIYGTTEIGGTLPDGAPGGASGTIFSMKPDGSDYTILHTFAGSTVSDASGPNSRLVLSGGTLYGATSSGGGADNPGTIYSISTDGTNYKLLHIFDGGDGGENPFNAPAVAGSTIIGTTANGGASSGGVLFSMNTDGTGFTVQHTFSTSVDGGLSEGDMLVSGSKVYGSLSIGGGPITASPEGTVFSVNTDGTGFQNVYVFNGQNANDGLFPFGELATDGTNIYGTDTVGGANGLGAIFSVPINASGGGGGGGSGALPDVVGQITEGLFNGHAITPSDRLVPGDKITVEVEITNQGAGDVDAASAQIAFSAGLAPTPSPGDIPIETFTVNHPRLAAGKSADLTYTLVVPEDIGSNSYFLLADLDSANDIPESNEDNNIAVSDFSVPVVLEAGQVGSRNNVTLTLPAGNNTLATFTLAGGGNVQVTPVAGENGTQVFNLTITGSSTKSAVTITAKALSKQAGASGPIQLGNVTIGGVTPGVQSLAASATADSLTHAATAQVAPLVLKSFTAANGVLVGTFEAEGAIQTLKIGEVSGGLIKIDAPPPGTTVAPLVLTIPTDIHDGSIESAIPIKSLTTVDWTNDDALHFLSAPSIAALTITGSKTKGHVVSGDFQANVAGPDGTAAILTTAKIAGSLTGGTWNLTGPPASIQVLGDLGSADNPVTINAVAIKSLKVGGNLDHATILLSQPVDPKNAALGTLTVTGSVNASSISSVGDIASATVGAMSGSSIFAGVDTANNAIGVVPDAAGDFTTGSTAAITKLTVTGVKNQAVSFQASIIAAAQLGTITIADVAPADDTPAGVVGESLVKSYIRTASKKVALKVAGPKSGAVSIEQLDGYVVKLVV